MGRRNKPRKWSNLKGQVADVPVEMSPWMQEVMAQADARGDRSMEDLAKEYYALEQEATLARQAESKRNILFAAIDRCILKHLERVKEVAGTDLWRGAEGGTFSPKFTPHPVVADPVALMQWLRDTDQLHLLTLPKSRLKSIVCEALDTELASSLTPAQRALIKPGDPSSGAPPPGVNVFLHTGVHHTSPRSTHLPNDAEDTFGPFEDED